MITNTKAIVINSLEVITVLPISDIVYCQAEGAYSKIFTNDGGSVLWCKRIGEVFKELDDGRFIKISKSILLNKTYIKKVHKKKKLVEVGCFDKRTLAFTIQLRTFIDTLSS